MESLERCPDCGQRTLAPNFTEFAPRVMWRCINIVGPKPCQYKVLARAVDVPAPRGLPTPPQSPVLRPTPVPLPEPDEPEDAAGPIYAVMDRVCELCNVTRLDLTSPSRRKHLVFARMIVVAAVRTNSAVPYSSLSKLLGRRDHGTTHHAATQAEALAHVRAGLLVGGHIMPSRSMTVGELVKAAASVVVTAP